MRNHAAFKLAEFRIRWPVLIVLLLLHLGAVLSPFYFTRAALTWALVFWVITGLFGITVGYHRLFAHRSFQTYRLIAWFHALCASLAYQQGPASWVRLHRAHHVHSDTDKDPHPQMFGIFFGHVGWAFLSHRQIGRSDMTRKQPDDILSDPVLIFFEKYHVPIALSSFILFYIWGGLPFLLWVGCLRTVLVMHITWSVNSVSHRFGWRRFQTKDSSTNNPIVALLAFGEGWHNNHHRFPNSPQMGLAWWELDLSWAYILLLSKLGLAWNLRTPSTEKIPVFLDN